MSAKREAVRQKVTNVRRIGHEYITTRQKDCLVAALDLLIDKYSIMAAEEMSAAMAAACTEGAKRALEYARLEGEARGVKDQVISAFSP